MRATSEAGTADGMHAVVVTAKANGQRLTEWRLLPDLAADADLVARWLDIAALNARVSHPACGRVAEWGVDERGPFLTSCAEVGVPLRTALPVARLGTPVVDLAMVVACTLLEACEAARSVDQLLVHLDLDPDAVLVRSDGMLAVPAFGLWGVLPPRDRAERRLASGRMSYASPELIRAAPIDGRSDVFSIGVLLCELLTGQHPFPGATPPAVALAIAEGKRARVSATLPAALGDVLDAMLAPDPGERFQSPMAALRALRSAVPPAASARTQLAAHVAVGVPPVRSRNLHGRRTEDARTTRVATRPARSERTRLGFAASAVLDGPRRSAAPAARAQDAVVLSAPVPPTPPPLLSTCATSRAPSASAVPLPPDRGWAYAERFARPSKPPAGAPAWRDPSATVFRQSLDFTLPVVVTAQSSLRERAAWGVLLGVPILLIAYFACRLVL